LGQRPLTPVVAAPESVEFDLSDEFVDSRRRSLGVRVGGSTCATVFLVGGVVLLLRGKDSAGIPLLIPGLMCTVGGAVALVLVAYISCEPAHVALSESSIEIRCSPFGGASIPWSGTFPPFYLIWAEPIEPASGWRTSVNLYFLGYGPLSPGGTGPTRSLRISRDAFDAILQGAQTRAIQIAAAAVPDRDVIGMRIHTTCLGDIPLTDGR
jgi:drug/metabolite transporter (DMT)-like permease